ncbi:hypothetical protein BT93_D1873 [Corymbia citriodora subsp. variegata]|nr:hypothetical protein BT93_D1873 [Corymbia citriodora subsp. variegata]
MPTNTDPPFTNPTRHNPLTPSPFETLTLPSLLYSEKGLDPKKIWNLRPKKMKEEDQTHPPLLVEEELCPSIWNTHLSKK